jgi:hypothetical protein
MVVCDFRFLFAANKQKLPFFVRSVFPYVYIRGGRQRFKRFLTFALASTKPKKSAKARKKVDKLKRQRGKETAEETQGERRWGRDRGLIQRETDRGKR